jgi:hypothetical protein
MDLLFGLGLAIWTCDLNGLLIAVWAWAWAWFSFFFGLLFWWVAGWCLVLLDWAYCSTVLVRPLLFIRFYNF